MNSLSKRWRVFGVIVAFVSIFSACAEQSAPAPSVPPALISKPQEPAPERLQALPTPSPTAAQASASEYLPFEDIFLRYSEKVSGKTIECAIEFFSEETGLVQRHFTGGEKSRVEVSQYRDGGITRTFQIDGIDYFQNFTPLPDRGSEVLIQEPIAVGNRWEVPGGVREITALNKRVPFPNSFGEFSVLEVTTNYEDKRVLVQQYMKNVGLVAETLTDANGNLVRDMQVFEREKGRAITKIVRFYYVYPKANALRYIDREITFGTNEDLKAKFADEWRNVPPGSGLVPLSPDVEITTMSPTQEGSVQVDFTDALIHNMRLGPQGEKLLIQAITNTLAGYFKRQLIWINVGGIPYEMQSTALDPLGYLLPTSDALEYK